MTERPKRQDLFQWWMSRISTLKGYEEEAARLYHQTKTAYSTGPWAILKHAILTYYVDIYTTIIKAIFKRAYYLDVFAGPGLDKIRETDEVIFGSPLIADRATKSRRKFDKLILIEKNHKYTNALKTLIPHAKVINTNANEEGIRLAIDELDQDGQYPVLAFVDPEGLDIDWSTLEHLLTRWSDVIVNYQPDAVSRTVGTAKSPRVAEDQRIKSAEKLTRFFGTEDWKTRTTDQQYLDLYLSQIARHKEITIPIRVCGSESYYYYIIVAVRKTKGSQGWIRAILQTREKIEHTSSTEIERLLKVYRGQQKTLV